MPSRDFPTTASAPWWRGASIYQIYPRSFADSNGDGIGDLPGVLAHLDHIASLNVDGIWLSPFFTSPMRDFGYDVADYRGVDPIFGSMADFDAIVAKAHDLGLKVIIDQVYCHTSDLHAWFIESRQSRDNPKADWFVWSDPKPDGSPPNNWQAVFGGPCWTWDARRQQYYLHNFLPSQPQLNLHNAAVQDAILDVLRFWFDKGVDGVRLDAINFAMHDPHLRDNPAVDGGPVRATRPYDFQHHRYNQSHPKVPDFLARIRAVADSYGDRFLLAEIGGELSHLEMKAYTQPPSLLHSAYGFRYLYAPTLEPAIIREASSAWPDDPAIGWPTWTFSNHDAPRAVSRWAQGRNEATTAKCALLLLCCLRGSLILYQGEELGLPQGEVPFHRLQDPEAIANWPQTLGRDGARTPMPWRAAAPFAGFSSIEPWLPIDARHGALAVDVQEADPFSTLQFARLIFTLRRQSAAMRLGSMEFLEAPEPILAFTRQAAGERVLCVVNLGAENARWRLPNGAKAILGLQVVEDAANGELDLAPHGGLIADWPV